MFFNRDKIQQASKFWDKNIRIHEEKKEYIHWLDSPLVQEYCLKKLPLGNKKIPVTQWVDWIREKYIPGPLEYGLSLGCGDGTLERYVVSNNICKKVDALDNSANSIKIAKQSSSNLKLDPYINYEQKDINRLTLEKDKYNIVFIGAAAHHFENLEHIFKELQKGLKNNGIITINEFIGPNQFQWSEKQLKVINDLLDLLPEDLKIDRTTGKRKATVVCPTIEAMNNLDPSEGIRSSDIIPILSRNFRITDRIDYGGTILHLLLYGIIDNFDRTNEKDVCILKMLEHYEDTLISEKILSSDFSIIVARNEK
jgi:ubiquinone/menaquinone biosynthesis C-methylase UbiE